VLNEFDAVIAVPRQSDGSPVYTQTAVIGESGSSYGQFNNPTAVKTFNGYIFVLDKYNYRVQVFTDTCPPVFCGSFGSFGDSPGTFNNMLDMEIGIDVNNDEMLFVADGAQVKNISIKHFYY